MELKEEVEQAIRSTDAFKDAQISLDYTAAGKVGGFVVSGAFNGMTQMERQDLIWERLDQALPEDKRLQIVSLLTMAPQEVEDDDGA